MTNNTNDTHGTKRCVIYCRKSSSDGLDRDYTSIDCQADTCKTFIERHKNDGWRFTGAVYADGGFSGGTTNRPDFQWNGNSFQTLKCYTFKGPYLRVFNQSRTLTSPSL
ncbi:MAG: recombinase family protein [Kiritimatiellae bacterium]|nr:recombinase family protein [Kiritimatiellia bacterium]